MAYKLVESEVVEPLGSFSSSFRTASTMGTIMAVVAVFEIHIERNMVGNMNPIINLKKI
jgi:hypothetical protein